MTRPIANTDQAEYWASPSGAKWVEFEDSLDAALAPALDAMLAAADLAPGQAVLDIGCGTGISTLTAARAVSFGGHVTGADISPVMLNRARDRATGTDAVSFIEADAQSHDFGAAAFDRVISRFGVMFFDDPVAAFANIARAMKPAAKMTFISWGPMAVNPWFRAPFAAATGVLGTPEPGDPHAPGPMAFQDIDRVTGILSAAGLSKVEGHAVCLELTPKGGAEAAADFACQVGPAARILRLMDGTPDDARAIAAAVLRAFRQFETADGLRVPATLNLFTARRG